MNSSRWILLAAAALLLLGAGGTAWKQTHKPSQEQNTEGRAIESRDMPSKSRRSTIEERTKRRGSIADLPPHLRELVREFERRNEALLEGEDVHISDYLAAVEAAEPLVDKLSLEDVRRLLEYYWHSEATENSYDLVGNLLLQRWGKLDSQGALSYIASDLRHGLAQLKSEIHLGDPFANVPGMERDIYEIAAVFAGWASKEPQMALAGWLALAAEIENHPLIEDPGFADGRVQQAISHAWSAASPREAWENLVEMGRVGEEWATGFSEGLADDAPWTWLARQMVTSPGLANEAVFAGEWARRDPGAALAWVSEHRPEQLSKALAHWHYGDYSDQAWNWVQQQAAQLPLDLRLAHLQAALSARAGRVDELLPLLNSLPPEEPTWAFLLDVAQGSADPFQTTLAPEVVRTVMDSLHPPEETRATLEAALASRVLPEDPFADDPFADDPFADDVPQ